MAYTPLHVADFKTGLVQNRENFILPNDAYPVLQNAFVWRERIKRKQGCQLLGRLRRVLVSQSIGSITLIGSGSFNFNIFTFGFSPLEINPEVELGNITPISIVIGAPISQTLTDTTGQGVFTVVGAGVITSATINYATGDVTLIHSAGALASAMLFSGAYYPSLPAMGLRQRQLNNINNNELVAFDQVYAYVMSSTGFIEFIPGTTWSGDNANFFWSTNYWTGIGAQKIFWVTNFSGTSGDPIRYTNGTAWEDFAPQIDASGNLLTQCLAMLPFRGRMVTFNTFEGQSLGTSVQYPQRIRWSAIGNPFTTANAVVSTVSVDAWRDDIRGKGGFLNIPTTEQIITVGFVRDNLVIYCESSTWQLRYTGRSIAPFQIEKVNSELGVKSTFSQVQFDTSLVGIGDKGVIECDSFKSDRIDIKIPDLVFEFNSLNDGAIRVHGIRDFFQKLAYWIYPYAPSEDVTGVFPNYRLVYNYENDSWAIFTDSYTCLGTFQPQIFRQWSTSTFAWQIANFPWTDRPAQFPSIVGGNQEGFIEYLDVQTINDVSLSITAITGQLASDSVTILTVINHNLQSDQIIQVSQIPSGSDFTNLNGLNFSVTVMNANQFSLWLYDPETDGWDLPQQDNAGEYFGGGRVSIRDNFNVVSKKFNFLDEGQKIQIGYIDVLMDTTDNGAISMNMYLDYNDNQPSNTSPQNNIDTTQTADTFFNSIVPTSISALGLAESSKTWQRVFCATRANFLTIEWTFNNAQMNGVECEEDVQIDSQVIWLRPGGRLGI